MSSRKIVGAAVAACALVAAAAPASASAHSAVVRGTITQVAPGSCTQSPASAALIVEDCTGVQEHYDGGLESTEPATYTLQSVFDLERFAGRFHGDETFTGCVRSRCGTLTWRFDGRLQVDPETFAGRGGGVAHITGGTGELAGASGAFLFRFGNPATYVGGVHVPDA